MLTHYWAGGSHLKIIDMETGRDQDVMIPGAGDLEEHEREDIVLAMLEEAESDFKKPEPSDMTKGQQHDLGGQLMDIKASRLRRRDSLHGRWW